MTNEGHNDEVARTTPQRLRLSLDSQNCCTMGIPELLIMLKEIMNNSCKRKTSKKQPLCFQKGGSGYISPAEHHPGDNLRQKLADEVAPEVISGSEFWLKWEELVYRGCESRDHESV